MAKKTSKKSTTSTSTKEATTSEFGEEHRVFSHLMYLLFLISAAIAAYYTFGLLVEPPEVNELTSYNGVKALVFLGWAFIFKTLGHRIHPPHY